MISEKSFDFGNLLTLGISMFIDLYYFERSVSVTWLKVVNIHNED